MEKESEMQVLSLFDWILIRFCSNLLELEIISSWRADSYNIVA